MLGHLFNTRLRAAEDALRQGRLDEAYRIASAPDMRANRHGAELLARLQERLIERARERFAADRYTEALVDLDRAESAGGASDRIVALRRQVDTVAREEARQEHSRRDRLAQARRRIEQGSLAAGGRILDAASAGDPDAARMKQAIQSRDQEASETFAQVEGLIRGGQWIPAVERLAKAKALDPYDPACLKLEAELCSRVLGAVRQSIREGRVGRARDELACMGRMGEGSPAKREIEEILGLVKQAGQSMRGGEFDAARQSVMRLGHLAPDVGWASKAAKQLSAIDEMVTALRAGPLGAFQHPGSPVVPARDRDPMQPAGVPAETVALRKPHAAGALPDRLLLLVDGGGSFLLLRNDRVSIGRAASSRPADVPIFSDLADRHADIARVEDDYFLFSRQEAEVGGRRTRHQLLHDGDRVVLAPKAKFTFRLPSRKSSSATIDLSDTSKLPNDVRRVVLFCGTAKIGPGSDAHIGCRMARSPLVLFERDGNLWVRPEGRGRAASEAMPLEIGRSIEIDGVSMVAKGVKSEE